MRAGRGERVGCRAGRSGSLAALDRTACVRMPLDLLACVPRDAYEEGGP